MPSLTDALDAITAALTARYGRPDPFAPGRDAFESLTAALLDRGLGLDPPRRARAVEALRDAGLLDPQALAEADPAETGEALRSAGLKVQDRALVPLKRLARWLVELRHGDAEPLAGPDAEVPVEALREELSALNGIGPATADALLLFGLRRPVYPVDRATYRILVRHGWLDATATYDEARDVVERLAPDDPAALARLSAWFGQVGHDYCRPSKARCEKCPLRPWLPATGPIDPAE